MHVIEFLNFFKGPITKCGNELKVYFIFGFFIVSCHKWLRYEEFELWMIKLKRMRSTNQLTYKTFGWYHIICNLLIIIIIINDIVKVELHIE